MKNVTKKSACTNNYELMTYIQFLDDNFQGKTNCRIRQNDLDPNGSGGSATLLMAKNIGKPGGTEKVG